MDGMRQRAEGQAGPCRAIYWRVRNPHSSSFRMQLVARMHRTTARGMIVNHPISAASGEDRIEILPRQGGLTNSLHSQRRSQLAKDCCVGSACEAGLAASRLE